MKPPITLVALDHQPAVIRTTAETMHISIGEEVMELSASNSGTPDLGTLRGRPILHLGRGVSIGVPRGWDNTGDSDEGGAPPPALAGTISIFFPSGIGPRNFSR